jgi:hypothetical protein
MKPSPQSEEYTAFQSVLSRVLLNHWLVKLIIADPSIAQNRRDLRMTLP